MISELVTTRHLSRKAVVYVRQSHPHQVLGNQESQGNRLKVQLPRTVAAAYK